MPGDGSQHDSLNAHRHGISGSAWAAHPAMWFGYTFSRRWQCCCTGCHSPGGTKATGGVWGPCGGGQDAIPAGLLVADGVRRCPPGPASRNGGERAPVFHNEWLPVARGRRQPPPASGGTAGIFFVVHIVQCIVRRPLGLPRPWPAGRAAAGRGPARAPHREWSPATSTGRGLPRRPTLSLALPSTNRLAQLHPSLSIVVNGGLARLGGCPDGTAQPKRMTAAGGRGRGGHPHPASMYRAEEGGGRRS